MVLSVVGMSMAFAGSAAAAAPNAEGLSDTVVQSDATVTIEGISAYNETETGNSLQIVVENTTNGDGTENLINIDDATTADNSPWDVSFDVGADTTLQNGDTANVIIREIDSETSALDNNQVGSIEVDDDEPTVTPNTPADGDVVNSQTQTITVDITDDVTSNSDLSITANVDNNGNTNTYEINPDSTAADGVDYDTGSGTLTINPGNANIPQLQDGTVDLRVTASDVAGNENTTDYSFEVQTEGPSSSFNMPNAPYSVNGDEFVTSDKNETVQVTLESDSNEIADDSVSVQITGPDGYDTGALDYTADQYTNSSNTFSLTPEGGDNAFSSEGTYTVDVDFTDEAGNVGDVEYDFYVDTTGPEITDVTVDNVREDQTIVNENGIAYVLVTVAGDNTLPADDLKDADASTIEATVNVDGEEKQLVDNFQAVPEDRNDLTGDYYGTLDLADTDYSGIENDSAIANVTVADDLAGNALQNPAADASDTTFDVDTDGPTVSVSSPGETLGGYVNFTSMVTEQSDVDDSTVEILVGQDSNSVVDLGTLNDAEDIDTTTYPDGTHTLRVTANDDAAPDNTASDTASFTLDNQQSIDVNQPYLAGVTGAADIGTNYAYPVDGQFNLASDVFETPEDADVTYRIDGTIVEGSDLQFDANDYADGTPVTLEANGVTTEVEVVAVKETAPGVVVTDGNGEEELDNPSTINVSVNRELASLEATVDNTDGYFSDQSVELTGVGSDGDFSLANQNGGTYYYEAAVPSSLRDGQFGVTVGNATSDTQVRDLNIGSASFVVDNERPTVTDADIAGVGQDGCTQVRVQFSEPVAVDQATVEGITASDGTSVNAGAAGADYDGTDGEVVVEFDDVLQTGDGLDVTYAEDRITENFEVDDGDGAETNDADLTQTVDTVDLHLSEGQNLVSVPAETGTVSISDLNTENVETIYAWDEGSWTGYAAGDDTSDLQALEGGQGYVVTMSADDEIPVQAYNKPGFTGDNSPMTDEPIEQGWNLIGHWQEAAQDRGTALAELDAATYDSANVLGEQDDGSFGAVAQLQPGAGYWLYADNGDDNYARTPFNGGPVLSSLSVQGADEVDGDVRQGENVDIDIDADDLQGVSSVTFEGAADDSTVTDLTGDGTYSADGINVDTSGTATDRDIGTITATDILGDTSTKTVTVDVVEQTATVGTIQEVEDGETTVNVDSVDFSNADGDSVFVDLEDDSGNSLTTADGDVEVTTSSSSATIQIDGTATGGNTINVVVYENSGLTGQLDSSSTTVQ